ncbi:phosphodiester glycosidase family protein [Ectobacillus polymachus]|uniref:phosphodiester glycosidase family protein n=1 Tax=Ectobacillus polymachus TaxID=1508806 RepID=UPI003A89DB4C
MRQERRRKQHKKRLFIYIISTFVVCMGLGLGWFYFTDSGFQLRKMIAGSILSSQHPQYAKWFLSDAEIQKLNAAIHMPPSERSNAVEAFAAQSDLNVSVDTVETANYTAKVMKVNDPTTIHLVSSRLKDQGQPLSDLIKENGAVAGINAGGFQDTNGVGRGGTVIGIVIGDGVVHSEPGFDKNTRYLVGGFTKKGQFITGSYSINELENMGVTQAISFGPQLLVDGKDAVTDEVESGYGWAPRTAIGQDAQGNVIMIATDGRFYWNKQHRGASMNDMVKLFKKYNCVNAFALDGGGSTTMINQGELQLKPATDTAVGMRYLPNAFVVIPHK